MLTIKQLENMLEDAKCKNEKLYEKDGNTYQKGFLSGEIHLLSYLIFTMKDEGVNNGK